MTARSTNNRLFWAAALSVITLDIITKELAVRYLSPPHIPHSIVGDVVRFTLAYNPGAAFSMSLGDKSRYIFGGFAIIALVILWRLYRSPETFGKCHQCGNEIAFDRLDALPHARFCIDCKTREEDAKK